MVIRLIFHHIFSRGNLASSHNRRNPVGLSSFHGALSSHDGQSLQAAVQADLGAPSLGL